jgi:hypothetical protein
MRRVINLYSYLNPQARVAGKVASALGTWHFVLSSPLTGED